MSKKTLLRQTLLHTNASAQAGLMLRLQSRGPKYRPMSGSRIPRGSQGLGDQGSRPQGCVEYVYQGILPSPAQALGHILTTLSRNPSAPAFPTNLGAGPKQTARNAMTSHTYMHQPPQYPAPVAKEDPGKASQGKARDLIGVVLFQMAADPCYDTTPLLEPHMASSMENSTHSLA